MPITINGIGTRYIGARNVTKREGLCSSCHSRTALTSYDTRLWVVFFFIPIVPLGKKRIIDRCCSCQRHYVTSLGKWDELQQLGISTAKAEYEKDPSAEKAVQYHQTLLNFHDHETAERFRSTVQAQFTRSATWQTYLGTVLGEIGRGAEATEALEKAWSLKPDLPEVREALARLRIHQGRLEDARALLDFLERPGAEHLHPLGSLEVLAHAFQAKGRHVEALDLYQKILKALPLVGENASFRRSVSKSERALHQPLEKSILPRLPFSFARTWRGSGRKWILAAGLMMAGLLAAVAYDFYLRRHVALTIVNETNHEAMVAFDKAAPWIVPPHQRRQIEVAEGHHEVKTGDAADPTVPLEVERSVSERWSGEVLWVWNVDRAAVIEREEAHYASPPVPSTIRFHGGQLVEKYTGITHPFQALPASVSVESLNTEKILTGLSIFTPGPYAALDQMLSRDDVIPALDFAEKILPWHLKDAALLSLYISAGTRSHQLARVTKFLQSYLEKVPVQVAVHRSYQDARRAGSEDAESDLVREYDDRLAKDPKNALWLYLRGRVTAPSAGRRRYFERAVEADPHQPWPAFALGYEHMKLGAWAEARPLLATAVAAEPDNNDFDDSWFLCRLALQEYEDLILELRKAWQESPEEDGLPYRLAEVFAALGDTTRLSGLLAEYRRRRQDSVVRKDFEVFVWEVRGMPEKVLQTIGSDGRYSSVRQDALIDLGRMEQAATAWPLPESGKDPYRQLSMALGWMLKGEASKAHACEVLAAKAAAAAYGKTSTVAEIFAHLDAPDPEQLSSLPVDPQKQSLVAALMARHMSRDRQALNEYAKKFNVRRSYPYALVERAINTP